MKLTSSLLISAMFLASAGIANAQSRVDVPVSVEIVSATDLVTFGIGSDGDIGQIAQSPNSICRYGYDGDIFTIFDVASGESVPSPGSTRSGCAHTGDVQRPVVEITCPPSMIVPVSVGIDQSINGVEFSASQLLVDGSWISRTGADDEVYFELTCPDGNTSELTATSEIELGIIAGISNAVDVPTGRYDVNIPFSVNF
ncbi:hypothetical protein [Ponticaulis sp.]|uniref:hypothetical protein n=1 Tax=Ponticaulis sp. TaxID=2020902 RepID=UPI0025E59E67|nr:hypothetical protein [Ponticaulis sp.]